MEDKLIKAWNESWEKASLKTRMMIIIETDILIDAFSGNASTENCDTAHRIAVRLSEKLLEEIKMEP